MGSVPIDVKFGQLIEGKMEAGDSDEEDDEDKESPKTQPQDTPAEPDDRPLVEQYRDSWSYPRFEGFAKTLISSIAGTTAV
jgi:hypothetical protein